MKKRLIAAVSEPARPVEVPGGHRVAAAWPRRPAVVIAASAVLALALRLFQLSRPGYLSGYTQYDDGVYFGNAVRLVHGAIAYRDFAMVQPPGSMLLMTPVALAAKVFGTAWGLAAARLLTVLADTANVVLIGLLVRHRGPLAVGLACAGYAVYPAALVASQSLFLEPWLNLFCLLGAVLEFRTGRPAGSRGLAWGGACFGLATAVKIWALAPALLAGLTVPGWRGRAWFAGGFAAGLAVPCLPFLVLAVALPVARLAAAARDRPGRPRPVIAVPVIAVPVIAVPVIAVPVIAVLAIAVLALASVSASVRQGPVRSYAAADGLIPPGACVVTDTASATIAVNRFVAASPGCPPLVDSVGTLIATTGGQDLVGSQAARAADTRAWQQVFSRARYVWLIGNGGNTGARIAWTPSLGAYFGRHFRLLRYASAFRGQGNVPRGGLYVRG